MSQGFGALARSIKYHSLLFKYKVRTQKLDFFIFFMNRKELSETLSIMGDHTRSSQEIQEAWNRLCLDIDTKSWIRSVAWSFSGGDYLLAEDLRQEAWIQIRLAAHNYSPSKCPFPWLKTVVQNHFRNLTKNQEGRWKRLRRYRKGTRSEDVLGDDPNLPPD